LDIFPNQHQCLSSGSPQLFCLAPISPPTWHTGFLGQALSLSLSM
jgi:hypothetical protein